MQGLEAALEQLREERDGLASQKEQLQKQHQEEADLTLLQLEQVQEELEYYFLQSQRRDQLAQAQQYQLERSQVLMARLLPQANLEAVRTGVPVDVLPSLAAAQTTQAVETEGLLHSYAASLHRAAVLLQRAMSH